MFQRHIWDHLGHGSYICHHAGCFHSCLLTIRQRPHGLECGQSCSAAKGVICWAMLGGPRQSCGDGSLVGVASDWDVGLGKECPDLVETGLRDLREGKAWWSGSKCCCRPGPGRKMLGPVELDWLVGALCCCVELSAHWCGSCWLRDWPHLRQCFVVEEVELALEGQCHWLDWSLVLLWLLPMQL